ncbi:MAG: hypothetical protein QXX38_00920 [Candidatus Aenigmatarchaeota archaeon]
MEQVDLYKNYDEFYESLPKKVKTKMEELPESQYKRLKTMFERYFSDDFYKTTLKTAFLSLESVFETTRKIYSTTLICGIRGSVIRGTINYKDDIDIVFIGTKRKSVLKETRRALITYSLDLKRRFPQIERVEIIYLYSQELQKTHTNRKNCF